MDATTLSQNQEPPATGPRLLSKAEVIEFTGKTFPTIWQWMREGTFPNAHQIGGRAMWRSTEIDEWFNAQPLVQYKPLPAKRRARA